MIPLFFSTIKNLYHYFLYINRIYIVLTYSNDNYVYYALIACLRFGEPSQKSNRFLKNYITLLDIDILDI